MLIVSIVVLKIMNENRNQLGSEISVKERTQNEMKDFVK